MCRQLPRSLDLRCEVMKMVSRLMLDGDSRWRAAKVGRYLRNGEICSMANIHPDGTSRPGTDAGAFPTVQALPLLSL